METSVFLARLIGPVLLAISASILLNPANIRAMANDFLDHRGLIFLAGFLTLLGGLAIVLTHNVWEWHWPVIITVLGWLSVVAGIVRIVFPDTVQSMGRSMLQKPGLFTGSAAVQGVLGAVLCYVGYLA